MTTYGNGFRGIGSRYNYFDEKGYVESKFNVNNINSTNVIENDDDTNKNNAEVNITIKNNIKLYNNEIYIIKNVGLFNYLNQSDEKTTKNLNLSGEIIVENSNVTNEIKVENSNMINVGLLAGIASMGDSATNKLTIDNVNVEDATLQGGDNVGSLIGAVRNSVHIHIKDGSYQSFRIKAYESAGGVVGRNSNDGGNSNDGRWIVFENLTVGGNTNEKVLIQGRQVGGVIGILKTGKHSETTKFDTYFKDITIGGDTPSDKENVLIHAINRSDLTCGAGGVCGYAETTINKKIRMQDIKVNNTTIFSDIIYNQIGTSGGVLGRLNSGYIVMDRIEVANSNILTTLIPSRFGKAGSLLGILGYNTANLKANDVYWNNNLAGYYLKQNSSDSSKDVKKSLDQESIDDWYGNINTDTKFDFSEVNVGLRQKDKVPQPYSNFYTSKLSEQDPNVGVWVGDPYENNEVEITNARVNPLLYGENSSKAHIVPVRDVGKWENRNTKGTGEVKGYVSYDNYLINEDTTVTVYENEVDDTGKELSGNGLTLTAPSKIIEDYKSYTSAVSTPYKRTYNLKDNFFITENNSNNIQTFNEYHFKESGGGTSTDFPVLVIDENSAESVTKMVTDYIYLLGNNGFRAFCLGSETGETPSTTDISINSYELKTNKLIKTATTSLSYDETSINPFKIVPGEYDNSLDRFTLIEVKYTLDDNFIEWDDNFSISSLLNTTGNPLTYTMYVPVIVEQVVDVKFNATVQNSTVFNEASFEDITTATLADYGSKFTTLLEYEYEYDWQSSLESGSNFLWNYGKKIELGSGSLPNGTKLTLVDMNNGDNAYTCTLDNETSILDLSLFKDSSGDTFVLTDLNDLIDCEIDDNESSDKKWVVDNVNPTIKIDGNGYRLKTESDTDDSQYIAIKFNNDEGVDTQKLNEKYYLVIETPKLDTNEGITIQFGTDLTQDSKTIPYDLIENENANEKASCLIYRTIKQNVVIKDSEASKKLESSGDSAKFNIINTLSCDKAYADYLKNGGTRYLSFSFEADEYLQNSLHSSPVFKAPISAIVKFTINGEEYEYTTDILSDSLSLDFDVKDEDGKKVNIAELLADQSEETIDGVEIKKLEVNAEITLNFKSETSMEIFPYSSDENITDYVNFNVISKLTENEFSFAGANTERIHDECKYYRDIKDKTIFYYGITKSVEELGINEFKEDNIIEHNNVPNIIHTQGIYDISLLRELDLEKASKLKCELTLYKKGEDATFNDGKYEKITNPENYIDIVLPDTKGTNHTVSASNDSFNITLNETNGLYEDCLDEVKNIFSIPFILNVKDDVSDITYANYKVQLKVTLQDEDETNLNEKKDYIIYTYACVSTHIVR